MSYVCILPNVKLKNLISKTEAAPKEHHNQGMSGWAGSRRGVGRFVSMGEVRTQALTMFVFNYLLQKYLMGFGQIRWHILIYTHIVIHMSMLLQR